MSDTRALTLPKTGLVQPTITSPSSLSAEVTRYMVVLGRPGVGVTKFMVPPGTTLGALLEEAQASTANQDLMKGTDKVGTDYVLNDRDVIFLVPKPKNA